MGLRTKAFLIGACLTIFSSMAAALGLGEIKLNSSLNQPLNAEIQLLHVRDLTEREILIGIASPAEFERAGVDRNFFVTELKFNVELSSPRGPVVKVTSEQPVREPFLNFIVTAQWPSGKLLREYTLLVDLPIFTGSRPAPVQAAPRVDQAAPINRESPPRQTPSAATPPETTASSRPADARANARESAAGASDTYGPVGANENLWSIASRVKPDSAVSVQQTMLAIQRLNPNAFINNNINRLRRGQVLRIPDLQEIQNLTARDAMREVATQNDNWNNRGQAQLEGSKSFSPTRETSTAPEGRVKLSAPANAGPAGQGTGSETGSEGGSGASEALSQTQEELDAASRENADLKSRLQSVEEQIQTMEKLVQVSSEEMRALELAAQQANQPAPEQPPQEAAVTAPPAEQPAAQPNAAETPPAAKPKVAPPAKAPPAGKSWLDLLMDNILYVGVGAGVLILALAAFFYMRSRKDNYEDEFNNDFSGDSPNDFDLADSAAFDESDKTVPFYNSELQDESVFDEPVLAEAETEDVVGECDIHIAYGQYDQAEEKLLRALEKEPANVPVRLKLMEVFAVQGDADSFDYHYARLQQLADTETLDRAAILRGTIDGIGDFDTSAYDTSDLARVADTRPAAPAARGTAEKGSAGFAAEALALGFGAAGARDAVSKARPATPPQDLDLDLQLDDPDEITRVPTTVQDDTIDQFDTDLAGLDFELSDLDSQNLNSGGLALDDEFADLKPQGKGGDALAFAQDEDFSNASFDELNTDLDDDHLTGEFSHNLVAEPKKTSSALDDDSLDFLDTETDYLAADNNDQALNFDLDRDLENARNVADQAPLLTEEPGDEDAGLAALDLEDLEDLDIDLESDGTVSSVTAPDARVSADSLTDFDVDFDLEGDVNLDELDQELDALAADFKDSRPSAGGSMEEPVVDFDDFDRDMDLKAEPDELELDDALVSEADTYKKPENLSSLSFNAVSSAEAANSTLEFEIPDFDPENDDDSNLDFLSDNDETATKLDLARAYIDMGDSDGAKDILDEILDEGNDQQKREAEALLARIG